MAYDNHTTTRPTITPRPAAPEGSGGLWMLVGGMVVAVLFILWFLGVFSSAPAPVVTTPSVTIEAPAVPAPAPADPAPAAPAVPMQPDATAPADPAPAAPEAAPAPADAAPAAPATPAPGN